jgi:hypothetical protein
MLIIEHVPELPTTALIEYEEGGEKAKGEFIDNKAAGCRRGF